MTAKSKHVLIFVAVVVIGTGFIAGLFYLRGTDLNSESSAPPPEQQLDTFTFFDIGPGTKLSKAVREQLENLLGNSGIETRTTIDLTLPGVTDFAAHFPRLQALHQALNDLPRLRVEHDTVRLTYQYARKQNVPFDRIRLVFSGQHKTPLFFNLYSKRDGADFIENIQQKHGAPKTIGDEAAPARTLYWRKEDALLIISITRNRIGFNEYHFGIYYQDNIAALVDSEKKAREEAEREKEKTGELAF